MKETRKKIPILIFSIAILLFLSCFSVGYFYFLNPELRDFKVKGIKKVNEQIALEFESVKFATKYKVKILDENNNEIYTKEVTDNKIILDDLKAVHNQKLSAEVIAYDRNSTEKKAINNLNFIWDNPTFSPDHKHYALDNQNFLLKIDGEILNKGYQLKLSYENNVFYQSEITNNEMIIPYNILQPFSGRITATIEKNDTILDKHIFYANTTLVGSVKILSPLNNLFSEWEDINFIYEGGSGATEIYLNLYKNNRFVKKIVLNSEQTIIDAYEFSPNSNYRLELRAVYKDYEEIAQSDEINIKIGDVTQVSPVYVDKNPDNIKIGTKISLKTKTPKVTIKYTTDGKDPVKYGTVYTEPIEINNDTIIKAYAYRPNTIQSIVTTHNFKIGEKTPVIYLSPSKQTYNPGIKNSGYTNEYEMMNKVTDYTEARLKEKGVIVYRNNPNTDMEDWTAKSRSVKADLHFAIHSNGSKKHDNQGIEIYVQDENSLGISIASNIYEALYNIYPYQNPNTNKGLKYAKDSLGEVHPGNVRVGVLVEIGFHDNLEDARWVVLETETIGYAMADAILKFYQVS